MASVNHEFGIKRQLQTPLDHFQAVCPTQQNTLLVMRGRGADQPQWLRLKPDVSSQVIRNLKGATDVYFTPNEFRGARTLSRLDALNAFFIDIDAHGEGDARNPVDIGEEALSKLRTARLPEPSLLVYTGRGVHLYWSFHRTTGKALPRWRAVQQILCSTLDGDRHAIDACRVLRMVGTSNTKAPPERQTTTGIVLKSERYDFDWLCSQILPVARETLREQKAKRLEDKAARASSQKQKKLAKFSSNIFDVWHQRFLDILDISRANFGQQVPAGHRNNILFHLANALSWFTTGEALRQEIHDVASALMPSFTQAQVQSCVTSVLSRSAAHVSGVQQKYKGKPTDARYRYKTETHYFIFEPLIKNVTGLMDRLRTIVSPAESAKRKLQSEREREQARDRVQEGRYKQSRADVRAISDQRKALAHSMALAGESVSSIAKALQVTARMVRNYLSGADIGPSNAEKPKAPATPQTQQITHPVAVLTPATGIATHVAAKELPTTGKTMEISAPAVWWPKAGVCASAPVFMEVLKSSSTELEGRAVVDPPTDHQGAYDKAVDRFKRWLEVRQGKKNE